MLSLKLILLAHIAATLFMVGLIWFVQIVHYPLFNHVGATQFAAYEASHTRLTTWVVGPPMLIELGTGLLLLWQYPSGIRPVEIWAGFTLIFIIWLATAFLSVPQHNLLAAGFNEQAYRTLVLGNWVRTITWSVRGCLVISWLAQRL